MEFILLRFLKGRKENKGRLRLKTVQPHRYDWIINHKIPLLKRESDIEFIQCQKNETYWYRSGYEQKEFCFVDYYVEIPNSLLEEWNNVHVNKHIPFEAAKQNWRKIYRVTVRKSVKGLTDWSKHNINCEYYVSGKTWGFEDKKEAIHFGLVWK